MDKNPEHVAENLRLELTHAAKPAALLQRLLETRTQERDAATAEIDRMTRLLSDARAVIEAMAEQQATADDFYAEVLLVPVMTTLEKLNDFLGSKSRCTCSSPIQISSICRAVHET